MEFEKTIHTFRALWMESPIILQACETEYAVFGRALVTVPHYLATMEVFLPLIEQEEGEMLDFSEDGEPELASVMSSKFLAQGTTFSETIKLLYGIYERHYELGLDKPATRV